MGKKLINFSGVQEKCAGRSRGAIYEDIKRGRLPKPFKIGRNNYWIEDDIDAVIELLREQSNG